MCFVKIVKWSSDNQTEHFEQKEERRKKYCQRDVNFIFRFICHFYSIDDMAINIHKNPSIAIHIMLLQYIMFAYVNVHELNATLFALLCIFKSEFKMCSLHFAFDPALYYAPLLFYFCFSLPHHYCSWVCVCVCMYEWMPSAFR